MKSAGMRTSVCLATVAALLLPAARARAADEHPDLMITLGTGNTTTGLGVPSKGDGLNAPVVIQGSEARRITGNRSMYLYVTVAHSSYQLGPVDAYVTVEFFDDTMGRLGLEYDKDAGTSPADRYTGADNTVFLMGTGQWRRGVFFLPRLRVGHGQNWGADFRLVGRNVAVRRISLSVRRPAGFDPDRPIDDASLRALAVNREPGMELTFGGECGPLDAAIFKALSVTSVESYVDWAGVEPKEGQWDWSKWDKQVAVLQKAGLKWVPFLIAGPAYATPAWFSDSRESHVYRCLEHGRDSRVQSLHNPALRPRIERFLQAFADRYRDTGVIESVLLGVSGIYGESLYPAGPEGGWTADRTGTYHNHGGWWAAEPLAESAFRRAMQARHGTIAALNRAWSTSYASFDDVRTFLPTRAPGDRARADFVEWYQEVMTDWSVFWVKSARRVFPKAEIYLCTGGDGNPELGADFTAQAMAVAPFGAGVRITNEGSSYLHNFTLTREVATSTRHAGTFCGFEPASEVDAGGIVARIYNATASGARQLHDYISNTLGNNPGSLKSFRANAPLLAPRRPRIETAIYLSRETWALDPGAIGRTYALARALRDATDLDFVTRRSVLDGKLPGIRTLVLTESPVLEPKTAEAIETWVRSGGTLIAATAPRETLGARLYDNTAWRNRLLATAAPSAALVRQTVQGTAPPRWTLDVGSEADQRWLTGDWNGREAGHEWPEIHGSTMRWTSARCGLLIPVQPGARQTLRLSLSVPELALGRSGIAVSLDGRPLGVISRPGKQQVALRLPPRRESAATVARLEFRASGWRPADHSSASEDHRLLGFSLRQVEVFRDGAEREPARPVTLQYELDRTRLEPLTRTVGKGRTITLAGAAADVATVAVVAASTLADAVDGRVDSRFATVTDKGVLWFDEAGARIETSRVEPLTRQ